MAAANSRVRLGLTHMYKSDSECPNVCLPGLVGCMLAGKKEACGVIATVTFLIGLFVHKLLRFCFVSSNSASSCINMALVLGSLPTRTRLLSLVPTRKTVGDCVRHIQEKMQLVVQGREAQEAKRKGLGIEGVVGIGRMGA